MGGWMSMGLRRAQGSRSKQRDSNKKRHALSRSSRVRERGMRLPSGIGGDELSLFTFHASLAHPYGLTARTPFSL